MMRLLHPLLSGSAGAGAALAGGARRRSQGARRPARFRRFRHQGRRHPRARRARRDGPTRFRCSGRWRTARSTPPPISKLDAALGEGHVTTPIDKVRVNNRMRGEIDAALGSLTLFSSRAEDRLAAAQEALKHPLDERTDALREGLYRRARPAGQGGAGAGARHRPAARRHQGAAPCRHRHARDIDRPADPRPAHRPARRLQRSRHQARHRRRARLDQPPAAADRRRPDLVRGRQPRLHPAARRHRARHHLRRHGRHQHGARRDDHARRLRHLRGAAGLPRLPAAGTGSTPICSPPCPRPSWSPASSAWRWSAASSASSTAARWRRCSPPGA